MKMLKKTFAIILVVAMLFSLASISVFAEKSFALTYKVRTENGTVVDALKAGKDVYVDVFASADSYDSFSVTLQAIQEVTNDSVTTAGSKVINTTDKTKISINFDTPTVVTADVAIATFKLKVPEGTGSVELVKFIDGVATLDEAQGYGETSAVLNSAATIKITPSFTATTAKAVKDGADVSKVEVGLDTAKETALAGITATVTDGANNEPGYEITWGESTPAYNAKQTGDYVFKGSVAINGEGAANAGTLTDAVTVTVTVGKIALDEEGVVVDSITAKTYQKAADDATVKSISAADVATAVNNEYKTVAVKKGEYNGTANIAWTAASGAADLDLTKVTDEEGNSANIVTLTGTLTAPADSEFFKDGATAKTVTMVVKVVPAEIKGGSISINNPIDNGYVTANITVPADVVAKMPKIEDGEDEAVKAAKKAKRTVLVTVESKKTDVEAAKGEHEFTNDDIDKAIAAVKAATAEKPAEPITVPAIKVDKKMKELGYSSSGTKKFTVNVTVGGTTLLNGDSKDAVSGEVKKATSGNAGGIHKGGSTTTTYAVTVVETKNGTATVSPEKAASGATVTVKPEPAEGYKVKSVTAVKADGTNVPVDEKAYTFTMPASAVKVTVEFEEGKDEPSVDPTPAKDKFADVADDFWAAKDIYTLKDAGIIGGKSATEFDPEGDVTRAEFAKMVVGLFGYKATSDAVNFEDCKAEDWFTSYVAAGVEAGVIKGVSDTEFAPNATITREDACTILGRALNKVAQSNELKFTDADKVAEYAVPYVALLSELGYVNGYEDGSFAPTNNITRAEAAKIIAGIYNANKSAETVTDNKTETDANADATVDEKVEEKTDEKAVDTIETEPEK